MHCAEIFLYENIYNWELFKNTNVVNISLVCQTPNMCILLLRSKHPKRFNEFSTFSFTYIKIVQKIRARVEFEYYERSF